MSNAKLNIPWTRTHEVLLEQQIMAVRSRMQHHAGRMTRGSADTEDIDAHEFYTGLLNVLASMRQPVTAKTLGAFTLKQLPYCKHCGCSEADHVGSVTHTYEVAS